MAPRRIVNQFLRETCSLLQARPHSAQNSVFNLADSAVILHANSHYPSFLMKIPRRFLLTFSLAITCSLGFGQMSLRAADDKADPGPPPTADETKAIDELTKHGARADQIANGVNWRYVNFRGVEKPDAALYGQLKSIPSIVELNLAGKQFTAEDLANISGLKNLTSLSLAQSNVTDGGLAAVENLEKLNSLNLFSTGITDAGLTHLSHLKNLHRLYLAETKVTDAGVEALKKALPDVKVNRGAELPPPPAPPAAKPAEEKPAAPAPKPEEKKEEKKVDAPAKPAEAKPAPATAPAPSAPKPDAAPKPEEKKPDAAK